jgi:hypothetical protein
VGDPHDQDAHRPSPASSTTGSSPGSSCCPLDLRCSW